MRQAVRKLYEGRQPEIPAKTRNKTICQKRASSTYCYFRANISIVKPSYLYLLETIKPINS